MLYAEGAAGTIRASLITKAPGNGIEITSGARPSVAGNTATLPIEIFSQLTTSVLRPSLYALGAITTVGTLLMVLVITVITGLIVRRNTRAQARADAALAGTVLEEPTEASVPGIAAPAR